MSRWRKAGYLLFIAPLHHILTILASLPAELLFPAHAALQLSLMFVLYAIFVWLIVPAFQRVIGLNFSSLTAVKTKCATMITALVVLALTLACVFYGIATPIEAIILGALVLTALHAVALRAAT